MDSKDLTTDNDPKDCGESAGISLDGFYEAIEGYYFGDQSIEPELRVQKYRAEIGKGDLMPESDSVETAKAAPVLRVDAGGWDREISEQERSLLSAITFAIWARDPTWLLTVGQYGQDLREFLVDWDARHEKAVHAAIAAEREACAKIAESKAHFHPVPANYTASEIAAAIRARGKA